jgi:hypothetical protein
LRNGWIVEHETSRQEIAELLAVADRNLADSRVAGLSADGRFYFSYSAALQVATAALAATGYRASREAHHFRTLQTLAYTIDADASLIEQMDHFRKKRNVAGYERAGTISDTEAKEMTDIAEQLLHALRARLRKLHPKLM